MRTIRSLLMTLGTLGMLAPVSALGQMPSSRVVESVDIKVLNQGIVALGKIIQTRLQPGGEADLTIVIDDVLKGPFQPEIQLHQDRRNSKIPAEELSRLSLARMQVLIVGDSVAALDARTLAVPTRSGTILREPRAVIEYIRDVLRTHSSDGLVNSFQIPLPKQFQGLEFTSLFIDGFGLNPRDLRVPVDALLEKWALEAIRSGSDALPGFRALQSFRSDSNVAFVKTYLNDPTYVANRAEDNNGIESRDYRVRNAAYQLLREWRIDVAPPILREDVPKFETLETFVWSDAVADSLWPNIISSSKNLRRFVAGAFSRPSEQELARIVEVQSLTNVSLSGQDKVDRMLIPISKLRNLEELNIVRTRITDKGLNVLMALPKLNSVNLEQTRITDDGLKILEGIPTLKNVNVTLTQVTQAGIAGVQARRPDVQIIWERSANERAGSIHESAHAGDIESVRRRIQDGRATVGRNHQIDSPDLAGNTPLIYAVGQDRYDVAQLLLDEGARVDFRDVGSATPLHWSAKHGYAQMIQLLLERKANVNLLDEEGNTALHFAVENGTVEPIRLLISSGASPLIRNAAGQTPRDLAERLGNPLVQEILR